MPLALGKTELREYYICSQFSTNVSRIKQHRPCSVKKTNVAHFLYDASKKLIIFNDISHLLFSLLGASDMHLNMPYLYFCIIDVQ